MTRITDNGTAAAREPRQRVLVTGGTGRIGRRVAARLTARGATARVGSRSGRPAFDWNESSTWAEALRGADAVYLTYHSDIGDPAAAPALRDFAALAVESGVRRLVLLSARGEEQALPAERAIRESGAEWTIVRGSWFMQNFSEGPLADSVRAGELVFPAGGVAEPFVDAGDLAEVLAAALTEGGHAGRIHEVTGPRLLTWGEAMAEISAATGREVRYVPVPAKDYGAALEEFGVPAGEADLLVEVFTGLLDGRNAHLSEAESGEVRRLLGRAQRDFADFAREAAAAGAWD
ncbi:NAD(P)H-binding protein [Streptomyces sp. GC420]|uniref:NAD(P)H-binding protein n=1 Tax=Streptomyces sp. GC420 TaxID=2697568 RepID=UPI001414F05B|nr:NAD(P)H-binding protein [Streptomyces sp. GC420]NBM18007.1 NAD(P)H-binding protein [Streptomyces sp. GC420]